MLLVNPQGTIRCLYGELVNLHALGLLSMQRASHIEPDAHGRWWADLVPVQGPRLGPFDFRSEALEAEQRWLESYLTGAPALS